MNVFNILKKACKYLNKEDEINLLNAENVTSIEENKVCQDLLSTLNFVICRVACEFSYCKIKEQIEISSNGYYNVSNLSKKLFSIVSFKNGSKTASFREDGTKIYAEPGKYNILYAYLPEDVSFSDEVVFFPSCITEDILATGVVSHYFLLKGFYTEYDIFERMFIDKLLVATGKKSEIRIKNRIWL